MLRPPSHHQQSEPRARNSAVSNKIGPSRSFFRLKASVQPYKKSCLISAVGAASFSPHWSSERQWTHHHRRPPASLGRAAPTGSLRLLPPPSPSSYHARAQLPGPLQTYSETSRGFPPASGKRLEGNGERAANVEKTSLVSRRSVLGESAAEDRGSHWRPLAARLCT